jgi:hypothetical protein
VLADFSTPAAALASLEDAYNRKDIAAAVSAKDFLFEAREVLLSLKTPPVQPDEEMIKLTAEVLELAFVKEMERQGFPDFRTLRCRVISENRLREDLVELVEECIFPDGGKSREIIHAARNTMGWHIVVLPGFSK